MQTQNVQRIFNSRRSIQTLTNRMYLGYCIACMGVILILGSFVIDILAEYEWLAWSGGIPFIFSGVSAVISNRKVLWQIKDFEVLIFSDSIEISYQGNKTVFNRQHVEVDVKLNTIELREGQSAYTIHLFYFPDTRYIKDVKNTFRELRSPTKA